MTLDGSELSRVVGRVDRIARETFKRRPVRLLPVRSWFVTLPGMRPSAPKRNVIIALAYLYAVVVLASVGTL